MKICFTFEIYELSQLCRFFHIVLLVFFYFTSKGYMKSKLKLIKWLYVIWEEMEKMALFVFFLTLHGGFYYFLVFRSKSRWNLPSNIFGELLDIITISQSLQLFSRKSGGWR